MNNVPVETKIHRKRRGRASLYCCFDAAGRCIYVGQTRDWRRRHHEHKFKTPWWGQVARVELWPGLGHTEAKEIRARRPEHNRYHNPDWKCERGATFVPVMTSTRKLYRGQQPHWFNLSRIIEREVRLQIAAEDAAIVMLGGSLEQHEALADNSPKSSIGEWRSAGHTDVDRRAS